MSFKFCSKYEETKARLRREILEGTAKVTSSDNTLSEIYGVPCYFCKKPIKKILLILDESPRVFLQFLLMSNV